MKVSGIVFSLEVIFIDVEGERFSVDYAMNIKVSDNTPLSCELLVDNQPTPEIIVENKTNIEKAIEEAYTVFARMTEEDEDN